MKKKEINKNIRIIQSPGWFTVTFDVKAGTISKDFRSMTEAKAYINK